jgi:hypothetical protein
VIFFPLGVQRLVEQLGYVKAIGHAARLGQKILAGFVERRPQVGSVRADLLPLWLRQLPQTRFAGGFVASLGYGQHLRMIRVRPIGQHRDVELVPLLQTDLINPHVGNDPVGIDLLVVAHLIADDTGHRFRRYPQTPTDLLFITADQQRKNLLLKAIRVGNVLTFEGRQDIVAMLAPGTAVPQRLVDPETGLPKNVQIPNHAHAVGDFQPCLILPAATRAAAAFRPRPSHLETVAVTVTLIGRDFHAGRKIDVNADRSHGSPCLNESSLRPPRLPKQASSAGQAKTSAVTGKAQIPRGLHLKAEEPLYFFLGSTICFQVRLRIALFVDHAFRFQAAGFNIAKS